jgi:hypothetical protein
LGLEPDVARPCGLELVGAAPLHPDGAPGVFELPDLEARFGSDRTWALTLDTLRAPRRRGQPDWQWRRQNPVCPVVFADQGTLDAPQVHLHLEHRFVQRLLGRFRAQGFVHHDLARACIGISCNSAYRVSNSRTTESQIEVDFVMGDHVAIVVKGSGRVSERDAKALHALAEDAPIQRRVRATMTSADVRDRLVHAAPAVEWAR